MHSDRADNVIVRMDARNMTGILLQKGIDIL